MRLVISMILVVVLFAVVGVTVAAETKDEAPRCENCGMFWAKSPTRLAMTIEVDGQRHRHLFECFGCMHDYIHEHYDEAMPSKIEVLDYSTFGADTPVLLDAFKASYLFGTEPINGSMPPYVAAFATKEAAQAHQEKLGGEVADFKQMKQLLMKAKGESSEMEHGDHGHSASAGDAEAVYVCGCTGGCCDDVRSSEPGQCPKCGMELELVQG